jgi:hypothetical protein
MERIMTKRTSGREQRQTAKERQRKPKGEALRLSPQRIENGATTTTKVLSSILERQEIACHSRHWGMNEVKLEHLRNCL